MDRAELLIHRVRRRFTRQQVLDVPIACGRVVRAWAATLGLPRGPVPV